MLSPHIFYGRIQVFSQESKNFTEVKTQYFRRGVHDFNEIKL